MVAAPSTVTGNAGRLSPYSFFSHSAVSRSRAWPVSTAPTIRETYNRYKPIIRDLVLADVAYQNACIPHTLLYQASHGAGRFAAPAGAG